MGSQNAGYQMERQDSHLGSYQSGSIRGYDMTKPSYNPYSHTGRETVKNISGSMKNKNYHKASKEYSEMGKMNQVDNQSMTGATSIFSGDQISESKYLINFVGSNLME